MKKTKENLGITLVALVITLIVLLILAGVIIGQLENNGLFNKTQVAKETYSFAEEQEKLEMEIANLRIQYQMKSDSEGSAAILNELKTYLESEKFNGKYEVELFYEPIAATANVFSSPVFANVMQPASGFSFMVDGKLIVIGGTQNNNIKEEPRINDVKLITEGTRVIVNVELKNGEGVTLKYSIQEENDENEGIEQESNKFVGLLKNTNYIVTVKATNDEGLNLIKRVKTRTGDMKIERATIELAGTSMNTGETIKATVTHINGDREISISNCKYIINTSSDEIGKDSEEWENAQAFTTNPQDINISQNTKGTYYLHVLSVDEIENKIETVSDGILVRESKTLFYWATDGWGRFTAGSATRVSGLNPHYMLGSYYNGGVGYMISSSSLNIEDIYQIYTNTMSCSMNTSSMTTYVKFGIGKSADDLEMDVYKDYTTNWGNLYSPFSFKLASEELEGLTGNYYAKIACWTIGNDNGWISGPIGVYYVNK